MDITIFLAQLWAPVLLAIGVGIATNTRYYTRLYRELDKDTLAAMTFGGMAVVAGTAQVLAHNTWGTFPEIIISLLGWGLLLKGLMFLVAPSFVDKRGEMWANKKLVPVASGATLLVGAYLLWFGYFMA